MNSEILINRHKEAVKDMRSFLDEQDEAKAELGVKLTDTYAVRHKFVDSIHQVVVSLRRTLRNFSNYIYDRAHARIDKKRSVLEGKITKVSIESNRVQNYLKEVSKYIDA